MKLKLPKRKNYGPESNAMRNLKKSPMILLKKRKLSTLKRKLEKRKLPRTRRKRKRRKRST